MYYHFLDQRDAKQEFWSDQNINLLTYPERCLLLKIKLETRMEKENSKLIQYKLIDIRKAILNYVGQNDRKDEI